LTLAVQLNLALICHLIGDYVLQTDAMATRKTRSTLWCLAHVFAYALPFLVLKPSPAALIVIMATHLLIDRFRLARYVVAAKNALTDPELAKYFFASPTGYVMEDLTLPAWGGKEPWAPDRAFFSREVKATPAWMGVWLLILADNTLHVAINAAALISLR
jgi:hypothetical protein